VEKRKCTWKAQAESEEDVRRYREDRKRLYPKLRRSDPPEESHHAEGQDGEERERRKELLKTILAAQKAMGLQRAAGTMALEVRNLGGSRTGGSNNTGTRKEGHTSRTTHSTHRRSWDAVRGEMTASAARERDSGKREGMGLQEGLAALQSYDDSEDETSPPVHPSSCTEHSRGSPRSQNFGAPRGMEQGADSCAPACPSSSMYRQREPAHRGKKRKQSTGRSQEHAPKKTLLQKLFS